MRIRDARDALEARTAVGVGELLDSVPQPVEGPRHTHARGNPHDDRAPLRERREHFAARPRILSGAAARVQDRAPRSVVEYAADVAPNGGEPPRDASVVCFPLEPKPHAVDTPWLKAHWV